MASRPPAHPPFFRVRRGALAGAGWLAVALASLSACGQKGDLYLPEPQPQATHNQAATDPSENPVPAPVAPTASGESLDDIDTIPSADAIERPPPEFPQPP